MPQTVILQDRRPKSYLWQMHVLLGSAHSSCLLEIGRKWSITSWDTAFGRLRRVFINHSQTFTIVLSFCFSLIFLDRRPAVYKPVQQSLLMRLGSQSPVSPLTIQCQFLLSTHLRLVIPTFFLRHVALLGATYQSIVRKRLPWSCSSRSERLTYRMSFYLLISMRPGTVNQ